MSTRLAIFASGRGTNAEAILRRFQVEEGLEVALVLSNRTGAGVLSLAARHGVPSAVCNRAEFYHPDHVPALLQEHQIDWIALAGFLWLIPPQLIRAFPGRIVNIHPALLPKHGGKGLYGMHVHQEVFNAGDKESGITIHRVDEQYDHGDTLFQASVQLLDGDLPETIASKVLELEHLYYPEVLVALMRGQTLPTPPPRAYPG